MTNPRQAEDAGFSDAVIDFDDDDPFEFADRRTPSLFSLFVQDEWQAGSRVTLSGGLRFDRSTMLLTRYQLSPRLGAAFRLGSDTVARASVSRFFQPPQPENLLLSSSEEARVLSPFAEEGEEGGAEVEPERQWAFEAGLEHWIGRRVRLDIAGWHRAVTEAADPNVFAGTTIIFPNAVADGRASGVDLTGRDAEEPRLVGLRECRRRQGRPAWPHHWRAVPRGRDRRAWAMARSSRPITISGVVLGGGLSWMHERSGLTLSLRRQIRERHADRARRRGTG